MSKVAIAGNASGTGTFTIASPNSNSDRTLTLPDNAGTILTSASSLAGMTGAGKVLQVLFNSSNTQSSTSTQGDWMTAVSHSITPSSTSSKILILARVPFRIDRNGGNASWGSIRLQANGVDIGPTPSSTYEYGINFGDTNWADFRNAAVINTLYAPSSTSAITITAQMAPYNQTILVVNESGVYKSSIVLMEIAG